MLNVKLRKKVECLQLIDDRKEESINHQRSTINQPHITIHHSPFNTQHSVHEVNSEGFTLMELMIVIVVFGLLVGAAGSSIRNMIVTSKMEAQARLLETDVRSCYLKAGSVMVRCTVKLNPGDYEIFLEDGRGDSTKRRLSGGFTLSSNFREDTVTFIPSFSQGAGIVTVSRGGTIVLSGPGDRKKRLVISPNVGNIRMSD